MANFRCKNTGFVFQAFHLEPKYTVFDNISVPLLISNTPKKEIKEKSEYMKTDQYIEDTAREKFGLVYGNEIIFKAADGESGN